MDIFILTFSIHFKRVESSLGKGKAHITIIFLYFTLQCLLREKGRHRFFFILLVTIELNNKNVPFYFFCDKDIKYSACFDFVQRMPIFIVLFICQLFPSSWRDLNFSATVPFTGAFKKNFQA